MAIRTKDAVAAARGLVGTPYGSGRGELDCINLIKRVIRTAPGGRRGYTTAGTASLWASAEACGKYRDLTRRQIGLSGAVPGMLAFKGAPTGYAGQPHHVGLVAECGGRLTVIHASSTKGEVVEEALRERDGWTLLAVHRLIRTGQRKEADRDGQ